MVSFYSLFRLLAALLTQPLRVDHAFEEDAWAVLGVARALVERLLDRQAGVEPDAGWNRLLSPAGYRTV